MKALIVVAAVILALAGGFLVANAVTDDDASSAGPVPSDETSTEDTTEVAPTTTEETSTGTETEPPAETETVTFQVWFVNDDGLFVSYRTQAATQRVGSAAVEALLEGPDGFEEDYGLDTQIPDGTQFLGLDIADGIATVDLTSEFESGGGSASMQARLAQIVYTLTQFRTVNGVLLRLDGEPIDVLGGEGVIIDHPLTRRDYADLLPPILVTTPALNQEVTSPVLLRGSANVFEANVGIQVLDADGNILVETFTTATCGTGCRGTYRTRIPVPSYTGRATIVVHDDDAAGTGTFPNEVRIPVRLVAP